MRLLGQPEVVAAAGDEGPISVTCILRVGEEGQLPTLKPTLKFAPDG